MEYYIDWLLYIKTPLCSWDNLYLVMIYNLFNMLLDQLASVLLRISASTFIRYWLIVLPIFLNFVMPWHVIKLCWNVIKVLENMLWKQGNSTCRKGRQSGFIFFFQSADLSTSQFCWLHFLPPLPGYNPVLTPSGIHSWLCLWTQPLACDMATGNEPSDSHWQNP